MSNRRVRNQERDKKQDRSEALKALHRFFEEVREGKVYGRRGSDRVAPKIEGYKILQRLRPRPQLVVTSAAIATQGVELAKKPYELVPRAPASPGVGKRIDASVRRAVKLGLGKLARAMRRRAA